MVGLGFNRPGVPVHDAQDISLVIILNIEELEAVPVLEAGILDKLIKGY